MNWQTIRKKIKWFWLWLWRKDAFIFLLFVGLAFIFWWGRVMSSPRDMHTKVRVVYSGIPENVLPDEELPERLQLTVRDEGKQLRQLSRHDLVLNLNLSSYIHEKEGAVRLTADILRPRLQDLLPGSMQIQHIEPEELSFSYSTLSTKKVPVVVVSSVHAAHQYQVTGPGVVTPDSVLLYGTSASLEGIDMILTDSVKVENLRDSTHQVVSLRVPEGVRIEEDSVTITWRAEQFTEKTFTLPIEVEGLPQGERIRLFPQYADVTIRVCISSFSEVNENALHLVCQYPQVDCTSLPLEVRTNHSQIYNIRIEPNEVEYVIEK